MPRDDLIIILDLETTGTDEVRDNIIEVGAVMLKADTLEEIDHFSGPIAPSDSAFNRMMSKDVVREMHEKNGLLAEVRALMQNPNALSVEDFDVELINWLQKHVGRDDTQIPYGGSGVSHFDRKFIKRYLPKFNKMITHWAYEIGSLRRQFILAGVPPADVVLASQGQAKDHRALQDARVHADEFRYYQKFIKGEV